MKSDPIGKSGRSSQQLAATAVLTADESVSISNGRWSQESGYSGVSNATSTSGFPVTSLVVEKPRSGKRFRRVLRCSLFGVRICRLRVGWGTLLMASVFLAAITYFWATLVALGRWYWELTLSPSPSLKSMRKTQLYQNWMIESRLNESLSGGFMAAIQTDDANQQQQCQSECFCRMRSFMFDFNRQEDPFAAENLVSPRAIGQLQCFDDERWAKETKLVQKLAGVIDEVDEKSSTPVPGKFTAASPMEHLNQLRRQVLNQESSKIDHHSGFLCPQNFRNLADFVYFWNGPHHGEANLYIPPMEPVAPCLMDGAIVFVSAWYMNEFFANFYPRIKDGRKIVLLTGESDNSVPFPEHMHYVTDPNSKIAHWFGQNGRPVPPGARFTSIPIGLNCYEQAKYLAETEQVIANIRGSSAEDEEKLFHSHSKSSDGQTDVTANQKKWLAHLNNEHTHRHLDWAWHEHGQEKDGRWSQLDPWFRYPPPLLTDKDIDTVHDQNDHDHAQESGHDDHKHDEPWLLLNFDVTTDGTGSRQQLWSLACRETEFDVAKNQTVVKVPGWPYAHCQSKERGVQQYLSRMTGLYLHHLGFPYWASPRGNGIDCHRTWEALYLGRVPILRGKDPEKPGYEYVDGAMDPNLLSGLPVLWVNEWSDITMDLLKTHWEEVRRRRQAGGYQFEKLEEVYWAKKILRKSAYWSEELDQLHRIQDVLAVIERSRPKRCWGPR